VASHTATTANVSIVKAARRSPPSSGTHAHTATAAAAAAQAGSAAAAMNDARWRRAGGQARGQRCQC